MSRSTRKVGNTFLATLQFVIASVIAVPPISNACTCTDPGDDTQDKVIDAACGVDVVFVGRVVSKFTLPSETRRVTIEPAKVYKGKVREAVTIDEVTTCDQAFASHENYLIFGNLDGATQKLTSSICGPSRFTGRVEDVQEQLRIVSEHSGRFEDLCGKAETSARRQRILAQDRFDADEAETELLHSLKKSLRQSSVEYKRAVHGAPAMEDQSK